LTWRNGNPAFTAHDIGISKVAVDVEHRPKIEYDQKESSGDEDFEEDLELEKRLNRKFDLHIVPWLFGIW